MDDARMNCLSGIAIVTTAVIASTSLAKGDINVSSGNYMLTHCEHYIQQDRTPDVFDADCGGVVGAILFLSTSLKEPYRFCPPQGVSAVQAGRVLVKYLRSHPDVLHLNYTGLAVESFREAWPCKG